MVSNDQALRQIAEGGDGFLAAVSSGMTVVQMSTVGPDTTAWLAEQVAARGAQMVDCPVLGSRPEAEQGLLWILAGGEAEVIDRIRPLLNCMGQQIYHVGEIGQATRFKLCNNLIGGGIVAALAEGMAMLEAAHLDPDLYIQILKDSRLPERLMVGKAGLMARHDFEPRFSLENMAKDLQLAISMGQHYGLDLRQGRASRDTLLRGAAAVGGDRDMAAAVAGVRPIA
jgi:3-hydroxyisobutyrate dehydrogenase-like beta-hydroxyacid dehydrogenase